MLFQANSQRTIARINCSWIIPLVIVGGPIMQVNCLPEWIFTRVEATTVCVELVRKNKFELLSIHSSKSTFHGVCLFGGVGVNEHDFF